MRNNGYYKELELIEQLNGKTYDQLNPQARKIIDVIFNEKEGVIEAGKCEFKSKPDIYIDLNGRHCLVSIKSGNSNSIHFEGIRDFVLFLRSLDVSKEVQKTVLLFQYGDGTMDGTGKTRFGKDRLISAMGDRIEIANQQLNKPEIIRKCIERAFFNGGYDKADSNVDYVLYIDNGSYYLADRQQLIDYALKEDYRYISTLHIGPVIVYPYLRDIERKSKNEYKRNIVHCKWINLKQTVKTISQSSIQ